ncbi:MAG: tRNA (adenosine(37)-N6)-threonylcarbamoyltransferase complex dimerization subunit type 1 TsaB [Nitrospinaceae bacterium]
MGIDASIPRGSVALLENNHILSQQSLDSLPSYSNRLLPLIDRVFSETGTSLNDVDGFCITHGPGSFTGLRVGVSLVKGFVLATEKPFMGVDTLEAVASLAGPVAHPVCAILDARKKQVYAGFFKFEDGLITRISTDRAVEPEMLCEEISEPTLFVGSGLDTYAGLLSAKLGSRFLTGPGTGPNTVAAGAAILAERRFEENKSFDLTQLTIKYVRKSEAELNFTG